VVVIYLAKQCIERLLLETGQDYTLFIYRISNMTCRYISTPTLQATTTEETDKATCGKFGCVDDRGNVAGPYGSASGRKLEGIRMV